MEKSEISGVISLGLNVKTGEGTGGILDKGTYVKMSADLEVEAADANYDVVVGRVYVSNKEDSGKCTVMTSGTRVNDETSGAAYAVGSLLAINSAGKMIKAASVRATGTITVADFTWGGSETVTVNGVALTVGTDFTAATSNAATALSLATAINNKVSGVKASASAAVVTVEALDGGVAGNAITLATSDDGSDVAVGAATLSGGKEFFPVGIALEAASGADQTKSVLWF